MQQPQSSPLSLQFSHSNYDKREERKDSDETSDGSQTIPIQTIINNDEQQRLYEWLDDKVKLPQYYHTFINNGFDDLQSIMDINDDELKQIGIFKMGHRKKIIKCIEINNDQYLD